MALPTDGGLIGAYDGTTGNGFIDPLVWGGFKWGFDGAGTPATVTYSFPKAGAAWISDYWGQEPFNKFEPFTAAQQSAAKKALSLWAEVANVSFYQTTETSANVGDIRFANSGAVTNSSAAAWAYTPYKDGVYQYPEVGDIWFDKKYAPNLKLQPGQWGFSTLLHEIGHALGLEHPFKDDPNDPNEPALPSAYDTDQYTVMSYTEEPSTRAYASTPQMLDILAIQYIYGANMTTRTGNDVYRFSTAEVNKTIWDAGGIDTLDFSNQTGRVVGGMEDGMFLRFGGTPAYGTRSILGIAYNVVMENALGSRGNDDIQGNSVSNRLVGNAGNDVLHGHGSDDRLEGSVGHDTLDGGDGDDLLDGGAGNDHLIAADGDDTLIGGAGADYLSGGFGNDVYAIDHAGDLIEEWSSTGTDDLVRASVSVNLATLGGGYLENAVLLGAKALSAIGNDADNELTGNNGANFLDGGVGADVMRGGRGGDTYVVDSLADQVIEDLVGALGGVDTVRSWIDYSLVSLGNVEKLALIAGAGDLDATGNALNNTLTGNEGANVLDGGFGRDTMAGGAGDDYYFVDHAGDVVSETIANGKGGGVDTVESLVTYSLAARVHVDHLILAGGNAINGTGNALANQITGNAGANRLDGGAGDDLISGGEGNDTLLGGLGNDWLRAGDGNDRMTGGTGIDTFDFDSVTELGDADVITDFKKGVDRIDISDLLDSVGYAGFDVFADSYLSFTYAGKTTSILFDADGAGLGNAATSLVSVLNVTLTAADGSSFIV